jgi:hypothetical protein
VIQATSKGFASGTAAARSASASPSRRKISMLRALVMSIFGWRVVAALRSASRQRIPNRARARASVMPTGPPPAMTTGTSRILPLRGAAPRRAAPPL